MSSKKNDEDLGLDMDLDMGDMDMDLDLELEDFDDEDEEEEPDSPLDDIVQYTGDLERDLEVELVEGAKYAMAEVEDEAKVTVVLVFESTPQKQVTFASIGIEPVINDPCMLFLDGAILASALGFKHKYEGETLAEYTKRVTVEDVDAGLNIDLGLGDMSLDVDFDMGLALEVESAVTGVKVESASMQAMLNQFGANHWADFYDASFYVLVFFDGGVDDKARFLDELGVVEDEYGCVNAYKVFKARGLELPESGYRDKDVRVSEEIRLMAYVKEAEVAPSFASLKARMFKKDLT